MSLFFSIPGNLTMKVTSDNNLSFGDSEYLLLKAYVPGITLLNLEPDHIDLTVEHIESEEKRLVREESRIHIFDTWNGMFPDDLYHLIYGIVRVEFLKRSLFPVHGACVDIHGQILIIGHSGSGKTSVVLKLVESGKAKIFSGNKTVVKFDQAQELISVAGTETITIKNSEKGKFTHLEIRNPVELWNRLAFTLDRDSYSAETKPVRAIVLVRLNDAVEENKKLSELSALHSLYPYFLDVVNADIVMGGTEDVFVGTPPKGVEKYLVSHLKNVLNNLPVHSMAGSASFISSEILKL